MGRYRIVAPVAAAAAVAAVAGLVCFAWPRSAFAQPVIDGQVDAAYGAAIASDGLGDYIGFPEWDLDKLYVTHDATHLYIAFTSGGDVVTNASAKYVIYIDTTNDGAGASADAWTRNVSVGGVHKPDYSINTWLDVPPYGPDRTEVWRWTGTAWQLSSKAVAAARAVNSGGSVVEMKVALADIGNPSALWIEVYSTGSNSGDNAQDTINSPANDFNAPAGGAQWTTASTLSCSTPYALTVSTADATVDSSHDAGAPDTLAAIDVGPREVGPSTDSTSDTTVDATRDVTPGADAGRPDAPATDSATAWLDAGVSRDGTPAPDAAINPLPKKSDQGCGCGASAAARQSSAWPALLVLLLLSRRRRARRR